MNKVIVVVGPTGVGKTKLSVELAKYFNGEIINADSMQFYKGLDIGTAKIKEEEKEKIPHHLFDICDINDEYSIFHYQKDARKIIDKLLYNGVTPIMVGGTGLYIKACLYDYSLNESVINNSYDGYTTEELYELLISKDKKINIDRHNRRRIIRALNYYEETGSSISNNKTDKLLYDVIFIGLTCERRLLYERINKRVDAMIKDGLLEEVKELYDKGIYTKPVINGIGYKELYEYFEGKIGIEEAVELIKKNTRHYAKRQYTFFNHQLPVTWFDVCFDDFSKTVNEVIRYIESK